MCMTVRMIEQTKPGQTISDGRSCLYLRHLKTGIKSFFVKKRFGPKLQFTKTIGHYPEMSLQAARAQAQEILSGLQRKGSRKKEFCELRDEWLEHKKQSGVIHFDDIVTSLKPLTKAFQGRDFNHISPMEVKEVLDSYTQKGTINLRQAHRCAANLKAIERWAVNLGYTEHYRFSGITEILVPVKPVRHYLAPIPALLPYVAAMMKGEGAVGTIYWDLFRAGLFTLLRPGEYCQLKWDWIDWSAMTITVPAAVMKNKRDFTFPVTAQLEKLLEARKESNVSPYVFSALKNPAKAFSNQGLNNWFNRHHINDLVVPHGIRAVGRAWMDSQNIDHDTAEMCLSHLVRTRTERAYNRYDRLEERRDAMERWCCFAEEAINNHGRKK